jgi:hemolysin activation/secretion protein
MASRCRCQASASRGNTADARFHAYLPAFFEFDARLQAAWASRDTPGTELPRFGGSDSVRGFKEDAAAARYSWALQTEVAAPIRVLDEVLPAVDQLVRRNLKLAAFVDVGGADKNSQGISDVEVGAGLGLRFTLNERAVIRLDFARPITRARKAQRGDGVFFSVAILPTHF